MNNEIKDKIFDLKMAIGLINSFVLRKPYHPDYDLWVKQVKSLEAKIEALENKLKKTPHREGLLC